MQESLSAGDNIAAYCTKCRLVLDHTVVAMDGVLVVKVKCRTCGSSHKFRDPADEPKVRKPRVKTGENAGSEGQWQAALAEARGKSRPYRMDTKYRIGDVVEHDRFGKGVVRKLYMNKCDVLFEDRERLMASGN
jgi:hypothetical protein